MRGKNISNERSRSWMAKVYCTGRYVKNSQAVLVVQDALGLHMIFGQFINTPRSGPTGLLRFYSVLYPYVRNNLLVPSASPNWTGYVNALGCLPQQFARGIRQTGERRPTSSTSDQDEKKIKTSLPS